MTRLATGVGSEVILQVSCFEKLQVPLAEGGNPLRTWSEQVGTKVLWGCDTCLPSAVCDHWAVSQVASS